MKVIKFEGTPEEFEAVAPLFGDTPENGPSPPRPPTVEPKEAIRAVLTRIPNSKGQLAVYQALADGRLEYGEFLRRTDRTGGKMAGVLGALGRRISGTKEIANAGLPRNCNAMLEWEREGEIEHISLRPYALEALREENIV